MKQEVIEKIAVERFPPIEEIIDIHDINDDINRTSQRKAFIEGALMVVEAQSSGAIPYESLSEGMILSIDSIETSLQCKTFEKDKYTSATQCKNCGREVWQHRQPKPTK